MANVYGPKIIRDGLVLYLDKYNERSYLGEPTTNLVHYTNLDTGWSKGYNTNIVWNDIAPPDGIDSAVVGFNDAGYPSSHNGSGYWYNYTNGAPQDPSTQYTVSMYVKTNKPSGSVSIYFYTADNSETGRYWSSSLGVAASEGWKRLEWPAFTSASNAQSDSLSFYWAGHTEKLWLCAPQMEANPHATKFISSANNGTTTTRSATDGWRDLTGNGNHADLTALTYTATNVPGANTNDFSFDGVDDYLRIDQIDSTKFTISFWLYFDTLPGTGAYFVPIRQGYSPINFSIYIPDTHEIQYYAIGSSGNTGLTGTGYTVSTGTWYNIVKTIDWDINKWELYVNGDLEFGPTSFSTGSYSFNNTTNHYNYTDISRNVSNNNSFIDGEIGSLLIHNKILTATEVLQNFNAHKGRYGL